MMAQSTSFSGKLWVFKALLGKTAGAVALFIFAVLSVMVPALVTTALADTATVRVTNRSEDCVSSTRRQHRRCVPSGRRIQNVVVRVLNRQGISAISGPDRASSPLPPGVGLTLPDGETRYGTITQGGRCVVIITTARPRGRDPITGACRGYGRIDLALEITY